jgi:hypothetical protein
MDVEKLKNYYNKIDSCSVTIEKDVDFNYIHEKIAQTAIHIDTMNTIVGELLIEKSRLEHLITEKRFEYKLKSIEIAQNNAEVKRLSTAKEREDFINYFLLKDSYKELINIEQQDKDVEKLLELAKKKARDLDKTYPKLKTLWNTIELEAKYIKKLGSDSEHIERVRDKISNEEVKPIFVDDQVDDFKYYNSPEETDNLDPESPEEKNEDVGDLLDSYVDTEESETAENDEFKDLYSDKDIEDDVNQLLEDI